jgi:hypothetical protein
MSWLDDIGNPKDWAKGIGRGVKGIGSDVGGWVSGLGDESQSTIDKRNNLNAQGAAASDWATTGQNNAAALGTQLNGANSMLRDAAMGNTSVSGEMLRQGLQQQYAQQRSMAASASPANAAMAARQAAMNTQRAGYGMSGQAAIAGAQERLAAQQAYAQSLAQQRGQDIQVGLGSRQNAIGGYGGTTPEGSGLDKWGHAIAGGAAMFAMSDRRVKEDIEDGDEKAKRMLKGLKAYSYKYKDERDGKGSQFGPMAQDLEKAGLGHAVIDTPNGKMVHGAKAALSGIALTAALAKRVAKLEAKKK